MKILASSVLMYAYKIQEILPLVKEWGYDGVEIWHFHLLQTHESPLEIRHLAQDLELDLSLHSLSWDLNYTSRLSEVREASLVALEGGIRLAKTLGAHTVVVHPGRDHPTGRSGTVLAGPHRRDAAHGDTGRRSWHPALS